MSKDRLLSDEELFDNNFGAWLEQHGVELSPMLVGEKFVAHIDLNELKPAILDLINTQKRLEYKRGFSEGQDSILYNGQIELITVEEAEKQKRLAVESELAEPKAIIAGLAEELNQATKLGRKYIRISHVEDEIGRKLTEQRARIK